MDAQYLIELLNLKPLPRESGYYRETYRSNDIIPENILPERYSKQKSFGTAIYYLLTADTFSCLHRISSNEIFHFYLGDPVEMLLLFPDGTGKTITLGNDIASGQIPQCVVPVSTWQGSSMADGGQFALMGTTVTPSFDFDDFEIAERDRLMPQYPEFEKEILRLTHT